MTTSSTGVAGHCNETWTRYQTACLHQRHVQFGRRHPLRVEGLLQRRAGASPANDDTIPSTSQPAAALPPSLEFAES